MPNIQKFKKNTHYSISVNEYIPLFCFQEQKALHKVVFGDMKPIPQEEYLQIYHATGLDIDGRRALVEKNKTRYEEWYLKYIKFAKSLPYFQDLPVQDQIAILKGRVFFIILSSSGVFLLSEKFFKIEFSVNNFQLINSIQWLETKSKSAVVPRDTRYQQTYFPILL